MAPVYLQRFRIPPAAGYNPVCHDTVAREH